MALITALDTLAQLLVSALPRSAWFIAVGPFSSVLDEAFPWELLSPLCIYLRRKAVPSVVNTAPLTSTRTVPALFP